MVEICVVISDVPTGGLEWPVVVTLNAANGTKAGERWFLDFTLSHLCMYILKRCIPSVSGVEGL